VFVKDIPMGTYCAPLFACWNRLYPGASQPKRNAACSVLISYIDRIYSTELELNIPQIQIYLLHTLNYTHWWSV